MPKVVALAHFRTREVLQPGDPKASEAALRFPTTRTVSQMPSTNPEQPTLVEVSDEEAKSLIAAGLAREEAEHERLVRQAKEERERGPVPQVTESAAPRGPASGLTVAPDPNDVAERAKLDRRIYEGIEDANKGPVDLRHSAPVDRSTSSVESLQDEGDEPRRRGRPPRGRE